MQTSGSYSRVRCVMIALVLIGLLGWWPTPAAKAQDDSASGTTIADDATVESLFVDFLHYARLGRFAMADAYARALLTHPDLDPVEVLDLASRDAKAVQTLMIIIENSSIGENAARVLELIEQGEIEKRKSPDRIQANIKMLAGDPQQEYRAIRHLAESGEYAIPPIIATLLDPERRNITPRVITALPKIGKAAVTPLATALGFLAIVLATINVVGGFLVTNRMLAMFRPRKPDA